MEICEEEARIIISRRIEEENTLLALLESERGRSLLLTAARVAKPRTLSRVSKTLESAVQAFIAREDCTGLVRVIAARAPDSWLIKATKWIISDLKNVLLNITSRGPTIILEELFSKLPTQCPTSSQ